MIATQPSALAVNSRLGVNSVAELVALLKKNPGKYNFGSIGNGSLSHLAMAALALKSGTEIVHIPYASSPQAMTALVRGDVDIVCLPAISVTPHVASGDVKILAVSTATRSPLLPDVPTLKEAGIDVEADAWMGLIAPAKTPEAIVARIAREVGARDHRARHPRQARGAADGADPDHAGRIPRPHRRRHRAMVAGDHGGEDTDQLADVLPARVLLPPDCHRPA